MYVLHRFNHLCQLYSFWSHHSVLHPLLIRYETTAHQLLSFYYCNLDLGCKIINRRTSSFSVRHGFPRYLDLDPVVSYNDRSSLSGKLQFYILSDTTHRSGTDDVYSWFRDHRSVWESVEFSLRPYFGQLLSTLVNHSGYSLTRTRKGDQLQWAVKQLGSRVAYISSYILYCKFQTNGLCVYPITLYHRTGATLAAADTRFLSWAVYIMKGGLLIIRGSCTWMLYISPYIRPPPWVWYPSTYTDLLLSLCLVLVLSLHLLFLGISWLLGPYSPIRLV